MTDHYIDSEKCTPCPVRNHCSAIVAGGEWNPYIKAQSRPCPAVLHNGKKRT